MTNWSPRWPIGHLGDPNSRNDATTKFYEGEAQSEQDIEWKGKNCDHDSDEMSDQWHEFVDTITSF